MSSPNQETYDDRLLTRYLLGALPPEETERLDELSIVDDEFASRLSSLENDLVDAYVRSELPEIDAEKFRASYLSSAKRREKVHFAEALHAHKEAVRPQEAAETAPVPLEVTSVREQEPRSLRPPSFFSLLSFRPWAFAGAALAVALVSGYLVYENIALQRQLGAAQNAHLKSVLRQRQVEQELNQQQSAAAEAKKQLEQTRSSSPNFDQMKTVAMLLPPPTRGPERIPTLSLGTGTDLAVLVLTLESNSFPAYRAVLKDAATNKILWQSQSLSASAAGDKKAVSISFPAVLLKQQNYLIELSGLPTRGSPEVIASYPLRVVLVLK